MVKKIALRVALASLLACGWLTGCGERTPAAVVLGTWTVIGHVAAGISVMSEEDADSWRGWRAEYAPRRASFQAQACETPTYQLQELARQRFETDYRISPAALGITRGDVRIVSVDCKGKWTVPGSELIVVADDKLVTPWNGVFFLLSRGNTPRR